MDIVARSGGLTRFFPVSFPLDERRGSFVDVVVDTEIPGAPLQLCCFAMYRHVPQYWIAVFAITVSLSSGRDALLLWALFFSALSMHRTCTCVNGSCAFPL